MLRLFAATGLLMVISTALMIFTGGLLFRVLTVILAAVILALYGFFWWSLPRRTGNVRVPGLTEPVDVHFDDRGVPHIYARNLHDLYLAQGYVTARDRLWAMDLDRRAACGSLSEVLGAKLVDVDKHFRTLGLRRAAEASLNAYSPEERQYLDAYAAGINAWMSEHKPGPEFTLLRYRPQPWTPVDTLAIGKFAAYGLGGNWDTELFRAKLVQTVGAEKAAELFWLAPDAEELKFLEDLPLPNLDRLLAIAAQSTNESVGSNNWAVAGSKTYSGAPLLASDPHLPVRNPAVWYQTHLVGPDGLDVIGVTFPGIPGIMIGHGRDMAWGVTNLNPDVQDIFVEKVNPATPDLFLYRGAWEKATHFREEIKVRGGQTVVHEVMVTRHGPVIARGDKVALSLCWTALEPTTDIAGCMAYCRARSWPEFRSALQKYQVPAQNFVFAGRDGTIAWRANGRIPIRRKGDGQAPVPGWTGEYDWAGYIPFEQLPETVNPPEGFVATANHDVTPSGYPFHLGSSWSAHYRHQRIFERLRGAADLTVEKLEELQADCVNLQARTLLQALLSLVHEGLRSGTQSLTELEKQALLMISGWDCSELPGAAEPVLWHHWYQFLTEGIFRPQMGLALYDQFLVSGMPAQVTDRLILQVAEGGDSRWISREGSDGLACTTLRAFRRAVALMAAKQGSHPERWRWGREHTLRYEHPLTLGAKFLRPIFNLGPFPVGGSATTVNNQGYSQLNPFRVTIAASWRQVVDLGRPEESRDILTPGQSGHPCSPHHADQVHAYLKGENQPQLFRHSVIRDLPRLSLHPDTKCPDTKCPDTKYPDTK
ncbi:MAG TPA: penicillin acylase family protein [Symbiobacteriaceae bacterium]